MNILNQQMLDWLLEEDPINTPVRFLALRDLVDRCTEDAELEAARSAMMQSGLIPAILARQQSEGFWENNKDIYRPKYFASVWQVIMPAAAVVISALMSLTRHNIPFALILVWAFSGIAAKFPNPPLVNFSSWTAAGAVLLILVFALLSKSAVAEK